jgi:hypothetical protein
MPYQKEKVPFDPRDKGGALGDGNTPKKQNNWLLWLIIVVAVIAIAITILN